MRQERMSTRVKVVAGALVGMLLVLLVSGCQMAGGLCRDIESAACYGADHMLVDQR